MWTEISVRILEIPSLKEIMREKLGGEIIPRSVLFVDFDNENSTAVSGIKNDDIEMINSNTSNRSSYLLCGLGDGHLINWEFDRSASSSSSSLLKNRKKLGLGSQSITLTPFTSSGLLHVFASCDRPTVISNNNHKLLYSNVNLKNVNYMSPFHTATFRDCLAFALEEQLTIGHIDQIQKLHIRTIPLQGQPRRIAQQTQTKTLAVIVEKQEMIQLYLNN